MISMNATMARTHNEDLRRTAGRRKIRRTEPRTRFQLGFRACPPRHQTLPGHAGP